MMMPPPMMMNQEINLNNPINIVKRTCIIKNSRKGDKAIIMDASSTVEKLLNKYLDDTYYSRDAKITFLFNAQSINRHEQKTIGDYFKYVLHATITVIENKN